MSALPKFGPLPQTHFVPDVLAENLRVVFCGTALGHKSALEKAYYAHPGNVFWKTLFKTGLTPCLIAPKDYKKVLDYRIGLTDLCKHAFGNDNVLPPDALNEAARRQLEEKIIGFSPRFLAFTSKTAAAAFLKKQTGTLPYGLQTEKCGETGIFVLPSPSGQGRVYWRSDVWQTLADMARQQL